MSKRSSTHTSSPGKKRKTSQSSMMNFFGTASRPIDLTRSDDDQESSGSSDEKKSSNDKNPSPKRKYKIYCDLDGVLVDFETGVKRINRGKGPDDLNSNHMWQSINRADEFYVNLSWMQDGKELWSALIDHGYCPDILTGVPRTIRFREEKFRWCRRELGYAFEGQNQFQKDVLFNHADHAGKKKAHERVSGSGMKRNGDNVVNVITCHSDNKYCESGPGRVLIDDRVKFGEKWNKAGGIFIHHTDTESTIEKMMEKGILIQGRLKKGDTRASSSSGDLDGVARGSQSGASASAASNEVISIDID